jgi:hypothetical protein
MTDAEITRVLAEKVMGWPTAKSPVEAWEVRNHLAAWGTVDVLMDGSGADRVEFLPWSRSTTHHKATAKADSAPRAICLAALRTVGVEPEDRP